MPNTYRYVQDQSLAVWRLTEAAYRRLEQDVKAFKTVDMADYAKLVTASPVSLSALQLRAAS